MFKIKIMKNIIFALLISVLFNNVYAQNSKFEYTGRLTPSIKKAKLIKADIIDEIMPEFGRYFVMPFNERAQFDKSRITVYPQANYYPQENYNYLLDYVAVEITTTSDGKVLTSQSTSNVLTIEQKNNLYASDLGSDIRIKIKFKFKNQVKESLDNINEIVIGEYTVTVIPEKEAEYPGGFRKFTDYFTENLLNQMPEIAINEKVQQAILKFAINEEGQIIDAEILRTSTDSQIDKLLLEATINMPKWKPAENSKGIKVKQEFSIPLGGNGGC